MGQSRWPGGATGGATTGKATVTQLGANQYTYALKPGSVKVPGATAEKAVQNPVQQGAESTGTTPHTASGNAGLPLISAT